MLTGSPGRRALDGLVSWVGGVAILFVGLFGLALSQAETAGEGFGWLIADLAGVGLLAGAWSASRQSSLALATSVELPFLGLVVPLFLGTVEKDTDLLFVLLGIPVTTTLAIFAGFAGWRRIDQRIRPERNTGLVAEDRPPEAGGRIDARTPSTELTPMLAAAIAARRAEFTIRRYRDEGDRRGEQWLRATIAAMRSDGWELVSVRDSMSSGGWRDLLALAGRLLDIRSSSRDQELSAKFARPRPS